MWLARVTREKPPEAVFAEIYRRNHWGNAESVSGYGSTLDNTASLRQALAGMFRTFGVDSVYDAPCGDFNWMREVVGATNVSYCGVDIVPELIESNQRRHESPTRTFKVGDITRDPFPEADLWICRDCFFHLSYADISRALHNFVRSDIPYVLMTTYVNEGRFVNRDIRTGDFRMIDLFTAPVSLPRDVKYRVDDTPADDSPREMCLWTREQIAAALPAMDSELAAMAGR
jgi:SAM-dependent methyltransferase